MPASFTIGHLARETGCKIATIRYYEQTGLLPTPARSAGNTRLYDDTHVARLAFIRHARELGFRPGAILELLALGDDPDRSCAAADAIAQAHLDDVNRRLASLEALKAELERMIGACAGGRVAECRIIETLADHGQCLNPNHGDPSGGADRPGLANAPHDA